MNNLKYCDEQKQICILNSRLENNIDHNAIDEEVKQLIDADIKNNLIQQSLLDAIRCFNIELENIMNNIYYISLNSLSILMTFECKHICNWIRVNVWRHNEY